MPPAPHCDTRSDARTARPSDVRGDPVPSPGRSRAQSREGRLVHRRDVRRDDFPAEVGEAHPRLALASDEIAAADLELQIHGGEITAERQDLEPNAPFLDPGAGRARESV